MVDKKVKSEYTTIPIKGETKIRWDKNFNQLRLDGRLKYQEDFIILLLDAFEEKYNSKQVY